MVRAGMVGLSIWVSSVIVVVGTGRRDPVAARGDFVGAVTQPAASPVRDTDVSANPLLAALRARVDRLYGLLVAWAGLASSRVL